ncbi:MAG TPA: hypothetical protein VG013_36845 [Gemmataceae bacterium]|jgi:ABC-type dipeptide/oligopeptide/nickel transport system ATPase component|nr:hypothetical protein [Gemmataceae bacterium]
MLDAYRTSPSRFVHTVHVMEAGRIAESGPPEQVLEAPREEVTRVFLDQMKAK